MAKGPRRSLRETIARWLLASSPAPATRRLTLKRSLYETLEGMPRGDAISLLAEVIAETVEPATHMGAGNVHIPTLIGIASELDPSDFLYLLSECIKQYCQQKVVAPPHAPSAVSP